MYILLGKLSQLPGIWDKRIEKLRKILAALAIVLLFLGAMLRIDDVAPAVAAVIMTATPLEFSVEH